MQSPQLKVKIKSLAAEALIIRREERLARDKYTRLSLSDHRRGVVRHEARHSLLAYGYLRGRPYRAIEHTCHEDPDWAKVKDIVKRFGSHKHAEGVDEWVQGMTVEAIPTKAA